MDEEEISIFDYDASANHDELVLQRQREIEKDICDSISLVGEKEDLKHLKLEYDADEIYLDKVEDLLNGYAYIRRTRPDGNCFYRAFGYGYFENLLHNKNEYKNLKAMAEEKNKLLISLGFSQFTLEEFQDAFDDAIDSICSSESDEDVLYRMFNESGFSDYLVVYLRLLTSAELQTNAEFYQNFIEGERTVAEFCKQEVEPMFRESDHIHIIALSAALKVGTRVCYMDRGESEKVVIHNFSEDYPLSIHLLYRPGHYDVLYPKQQTLSSEQQASSSSSSAGDNTKDDQSIISSSNS